MPTANQTKLAGKLLSVAAGVHLFLNMSGLFRNTFFKMDHKIIAFLFGRWLANLIVPSTTQGFKLEFRLLDLVWVPWSGIVLILLLLAAIKTIKGKISRSWIGITGLFAFWVLIGEIAAVYINKGIWFLQHSLPPIDVITGAVSLLASIIIVTTSSIIVLSFVQTCYQPERKKIMANGTIPNQRFATLLGWGISSAASAGSL